MPLLKRKISITKMEIPGHMDVQGSIVNDLFFERIQTYIFQPIDNTYDQYSIGFVPVLDHLSSISKNGKNITFGDLLVFSIRYDERKLPGALVKSEIEKANRQYIQVNQIPKISRSKKLEIKESVKANLLRNIPPTPYIVDAILDANNGFIYLCSNRRKDIELFADLFKQAFGIELGEIDHFGEGFSLPDFLLWIYDGGAGCEPVFAKISDHDNAVASINLPEGQEEISASREAGRNFDKLRFTAQTESGVEYTMTTDREHQISAVLLPKLGNEESAGEQEGFVYALAASVIECCTLFESIVSKFKESQKQ